MIRRCLVFVFVAGWRRGHNNWHETKHTYALSYANEACVRVSFLQYNIEVPWGCMYDNAIDKSLIPDEYSYYPVS